MAISTENIKTGGGTPKILQPGNTVCTIHTVTLQPVTLKDKVGAMHLVLSMEGPDLGTDFEGFFIDKANESLGRYKGQIGNVKAGEWFFSDGETKGGTIISRDTEILKFMKNLCVALDIVSWLDAQDNKFNTIEELIQAFNTDKPFLGKSMEYCLCGKEYLNKQGYINYELFLPKYTKTDVPFGSKRVHKFNEETDVRKAKVKAVDEFAAPADDLGTDTGTAQAFKLDED